MSERFEVWLRTVCLQKPTPEAYDLAKDAWENGRVHGRGDTVMVQPITIEQAKRVIEEAGMVAAPLEPTEAMLESIWDYCMDNHCSSEVRSETEDVYKAMIKAAQKERDS